MTPYADFASASELREHYKNRTKGLRYQSPAFALVSAITRGGKLPPAEPIRTRTIQLSKAVDCGKSAPQPAPNQNETFKVNVMEFAHELLTGVVNPKRVQTIIKACSVASGVSVMDIKSPRRNKNIVVVRMVAVYLCREYTALSYPAIGRLFGGKDHSTVLYSCRKVAKAVEKQDERFTRILNGALAILEAA